MAYKISTASNDSGCQFVIFAFYPTVISYMHIDLQTPSFLWDPKFPDTSEAAIEERPIDSPVRPPVIDEKFIDIRHTNMDTKGSTNVPTPGGQLFVDEKLSPTEPSSVKAREVSRLILDIVFEYALNKFDDSKDRLAAGVPKFLSVIARFVAAGTRVEACLPAFPFKSANKVDKVLGILPDKAEDLALERLNSMCARIKEVYRPGARVTIISDGITYNGTSNILCSNSPR